MGSTRAEGFRGFIVSRKWAQWINETNEATEYRTIGNVYRFDSPGKEAPTREDLERDWCGDLGEARER